MCWLFVKLRIQIKSIWSKRFWKTSTNVHFYIRNVTLIHLYMLKLIFWTCPTWPLMNWEGIDKTTDAMYRMYTCKQCVVNKHYKLKFKRKSKIKKICQIITCISNLFVLSFFLTICMLTRFKKKIVYWFGWCIHVQQATEHSFDLSFQI